MNLALATGNLLNRLESARSRIDHSLTQQRRFVSDASHELFTPIAGLRTLLEEARLHPDETELDELLDDALEGVGRLQTIVTDLLVLAKVGANPPDSFVNVDLAEMVRAAVSRHEKGVPVRLRLVPGVRANVVDVEITRLLTNLLDNAQRHARNAVLIEVRKNGRYGELAVADDGDGIAAADRERIFERFTRLDTARCRTRGGTGLGLTIARDIATAHRGTIDVEDSAMGGARFVLRLPLADHQVSEHL
ncbi:HAMP domain-containing sensor histidine kinase [Streptosporangium sp. NPDC000563]|uniref:sensor histidine kinase n=1 Tax=unclassified Streptosporangium TaxID=2632669 RepID=UPI00331CC290